MGGRRSHLPRESTLKAKCLIAMMMMMCCSLSRTLAFVGSARYITATALLSSSTKRTLAFAFNSNAPGQRQSNKHTKLVPIDSSCSSCSSQLFSTASGREIQAYGKSKTTKGKVLVLGGTGFLGSEIVKRAVLEGYGVTSISRGGNVIMNDKNEKIVITSVSTTISDDILEKVEYIKGDARDEALVNKILSGSSEPYVACIHAMGLLLDAQSGLGEIDTMNFCC
jgi:hypothetical protein